MSARPRIVPARSVGDAISRAAQGAEIPLSTSDSPTKLPTVQTIHRESRRVPSGRINHRVWQETLRFSDAPDVLTVAEAALLLRCGESVVYEILNSQRVAAEHGDPRPNELKVWRRGSGPRCTVRIPKKSLIDYLYREAGLSTEEEYEDGGVNG